MFKNKKKWTVLSSLLVIVALLAACGGGGGGAGNSNANGNNGGSSNPSPNASKEIKLAYVAWDSEIASTNVVREVLEQKLGYKVTMLQVDAGPMWAGISDGSADAMVAAWLPTTHEEYVKMNEGKFEDLGENMSGTKLGFVVPSYMDINSIEDLTDEIGSSLNYTITGIEPGAGIMGTAEKVFEEYGLKDKWTLLESSSAAMTKELERAYAAEEPIVVTGWTPHWKFAKMDLKYLEDPKAVFGQDEKIHTIVRTGLKEDAPEAYAFLDKFNWEAADMEKVMIDIAEGVSPEEAAKTWVDANSDKVDSWLAE
ncbi:glycine betaine ABC transporter substrate-binding protein [Paenibacillus yanchengensis]|uniref:Glycine betaine ABC transporter substrate-binding protein n=1 Tax=Paenibacillus yanchengensis TaxID=2035833 RepID=A0ABW4YFP8_9BACL